jgi:hypothetical protein
MSLDLEAIKARSAKWKAAADQDIPTANKILHVGASANDVPALVAELERTRATVAELDDANAELAGEVLTLTEQLAAATLEDK